MVARQAPQSMGFFRQEYQSALSLPPPGDLPYPGMESMPLASLNWQSALYPLSHRGRPFQDLTSLICTWELRHAPLVDRHFKIPSALQIMKKKKVPLKQ